MAMWDVLGEILHHRVYTRNGVTVPVIALLPGHVHGLSVPVVLVDPTWEVLSPLQPRVTCQGQPCFQGCPRACSHAESCRALPEFLAPLHLFGVWRGPPSC